jgi:acyl-coenzyme A synthetase/AMP-(fatty) acid ligase
VWETHRNSWKLKALKTQGNPLIVGSPWLAISETSGGTECGHGCMSGSLQPVRPPPASQEGSVPLLPGEDGVSREDGVSKPRARKLSRQRPSGNQTAH